MNINKKMLRNVGKDYHNIIDGWYIDARKQFQKNETLQRSQKTIWNRKFCFVLVKHARDMNVTTKNTCKNFDASI